MTDRIAPGSAVVVGPGAGIEADLALEVTGPRGRTAGQLHGSGRQLWLRADRPEALLAAVDGPARTQLVELLGAAGISAELSGPRGRVARFDPHRSSRVGALLWGSPHLRADPAGWAVLARAVTPRPRWPEGRSPALRRPGWASLVGGALALVAASVFRHRRRRPARRW